MIEMISSTEIYTNKGTEYKASNTYEMTEYPLVNGTTEDVPIDFLIIFGPTNPYFDLIHYTALVCLAVSIIISLYTIMYLLKSEKGNVFNWKIGQRLVFYLAVADLLFSIVHFVDHLYAVLQITFGFEEFCVTAAFFLNILSISQGILVMITAISAFATVVLNRFITYGKYDWLLLTSTFGIPVIITSVLAGLDWLGPAGFWCHGDMRKTSAPAVFTVFSSFAIATFATNLVCYLGIWIVITTTTKRINRFKDHSNESTKYSKTIRILALFVIAYMAQWWPLVVYTIWSYVVIPHIAIVEIVVIFANMGGVFNYGAYTFVRKRNQEEKKTTSLSTIGSSSATNVTTIPSENIT